MKLLFLTLATLLLGAAVTSAAIVPVASDAESVSAQSLPAENNNLAEVAVAPDDANAKTAAAAAAAADDDDDDDGNDDDNNDDVNKEIEKADMGTEIGDQVDIQQLVSDLLNLHESAVDVIERVETTLSALESFVPHSIRRRQTTVDGSVERDSGDVRGRIDVNHQRGNTRYNANVSHGRQSGTRWGAGVSHSSSRHDWGVNVSRDRFSTNGSASYRRGNSVYDANVSRDRFGTSGSVGYGRTWNNGRTSLSGRVNRDRWTGTSGGITFRHRF